MFKFSISVFVALFALAMLALFSGEAKAQERKMPCWSQEAGGAGGKMLVVQYNTYHLITWHCKQGTAFGMYGDGEVPTEVKSLNGEALQTFFRKHYIDTMSRGPGEFFHPQLAATPRLL